MLKKTCVTGGLIIATAAGTLLTGSAATAAPLGGCHGCWSSHFRFRSFSNNFNGNRNFNHNRIRLRLNNRNNNVAVARNAQRQRQRQRQFEIPRLRGIGGLGDLG